MKYLCVVRDHKKNNEFVDASFNSSVNCLLHIEEYIQNFVSTIQGEIPPKYCKSIPLCSILKEGCYVIEEEYLKYTIYRRIRDFGYLYNSFNDHKLFTITYVLLVDDKNSKSIDINKNFDKNRFDEVVFELKNCLGENATNISLPES
jgi:hypothetical protein